MAIEIDKSDAMKLLNEAYTICIRQPVKDCIIKDAIDFVMTGKNCLTYRYIMFTALLAKAVNPNIDILSLQAGDVSDGAYDARSLASKVIFPFQKQLLGNVLDGSNSDPLVNKPGRFLRLDRSNPAAGGDPKKALITLCDNLPKLTNDGDARRCVHYIVSMLIAEKTKRDARKKAFDDAVADMSVFNARAFLSELLDQGFGGAALVIVTKALYELIFPDGNYRILAHPVNQSGSSRRQFSDLDVYKDNEPFMGTELKDKPFESSDVDHAAETAFQAGASSLLFVAGRQSTFASQPPTYFTRAREKYAEKGMYVGVTSVDALIDIVFAQNMNMNAAHIFETASVTAESIGAIEAQMWIYEHMANEK